MRDNFWGEAAEAAAVSGDRFKLTQHVGRTIQIKIGQRKTVDSSYGEWTFIESDVLVLAKNGRTVDRFDEVPLSGVWIMRALEQAEPGEILPPCVIELEAAANGNMIKLRGCDDDELAAWSKVAPAF